MDDVETASMDPARLSSADQLSRAFNDAEELALYGGPVAADQHGSRGGEGVSAMFGFKALAAATGLVLGCVGLGAAGVGWLMGVRSVSWVPFALGHFAGR